MLDLIQQIFNTFLNMSITGAYIIAAVIVIRLLLRKAPKIFSYILWIIPALRLILPFSFSSVFSIFNLFSAPTQSTEINSISTHSYVPENIGMMPVPAIETGITAADNLVNKVLPEADITASVNPMQIIMYVLSVVWMLGIIGMAVYGIVSLIKINKRTEFATKLEGNVFECEKVRSPFAIGFLKPRIYLPCGMDEKSREYVILHEKTHIKRFDHITKLIAFTVLALHWYNPLVWVAFSLMTRDMEMSCDEKVLKSLGEQEKKTYGLTLVAIGSNKRFLAAAPLSFGENGVEERVVNILKFKKPKVIAIAVCIVLCLTAGIICLTNASDEKDKYAKEEESIELYIENGSDAVVGVEIVEMGEDNTAYCWMHLRACDYSYSDWLNGTEEKDTAELKSMVKKIFSENDPLVAEPDAAPVMIKAKFNDSMVITEIENIRDNPPVDMGDKTKYAEIIWNKIAAKSEERFKKAYGGRYKLERVLFTSNSNEIFENLYPIGFELVEYMGNPVLVMKITNTIQAYNTLQTPYYRIDGNFSMRVLNEYNESEGKTIERNPDKSYSTPMYSIAGGAESGKEYLCIYDLSPFVNTLFKDYKYFVDLSIETPFGEYAEASIQFQIGSETPENKMPELTYDSLATGSKAEITEKISSPVHGWISKGYNNPKTFTLSQEQMKRIAKLFNSTKLTSDSSTDDVNPDSVFCVQITDEDNSVHSFYATLTWILDAENNKYQAENTELFKTVADIYDEMLKSESQSSTAAPEYSQNIPQITKPHINKNDVTQYTFKTPLYTGIAPQTTVKIFEEITSPSSEPKEKYVVTDIKAAEMSSFELLGIELQKSYEGYYFCLTLINRSPVECHVGKSYVLEKQVDGIWIACPQIAEESSEPVQLNSNTLMHIPLPVEKYFDTPVNGRYCLTLPVNTNGNTGTFSVEFTITKYMSSKLKAGAKIENPISVTVYPGTSGVSYCYNLLPEETARQILNYSNNFALQSVEKQPSKSHFSVSIIDRNGDEYFFIICSDGTIIINSQYYKTQNGKELYQLLYNMS